MSSKTLFAFSLVIAVVLGVTIYLLTRSAGENPITQMPASGETSMIETGDATTTSPTTSQQLTVNTPSRTEPIVFDSSVPADIRAQLTTSLKATQKQLQANQLNMSAWVNLGTIYKQGGDYRHAEAAWGFVADALPGDSTSHFNLGDLYMNFLKDYPRAEKNFLVVVKTNPQVVDAYVNLFYLYHDFMKNDTKAKTMLEQGLAANPGNPALLALQTKL